MLLLISMFLALTTAGQAHAIVIYLDTNNNPQERATYTRTLQDKFPGERFVAIPQQDEMLSLFLKDQTKERDAIFDRYVKRGCSAQLACFPVLEGECGEIHKQLKDAEASVARAPKTPFTVETLRAGLRALRIGPREQVTLSISGHWASSAFTGNLGTLSIYEIQRVFEEMPRLRMRITQLHLLGCYTNTLGQINSVWRKAFPRARVLVGFHGRSPVGENPRNLAFIKDITENLYTYPAITGLADFEKAADKLLDKHKKIFPALAIDDFYQMAGAPVALISEDKVRARTCFLAFPDKERQSFKKILEGDEPVPKDTGKSLLRNFYTAMQRYEPCLDDPEFIDKQGSAPDLKVVVRLVFYRNVAKNFSDENGADLVNFNVYLQSIGVPSRLSLQNVNLGDRQAVFAWRKDLRLFLATLANREKAEKALELLQNFSDVLLELKPDCVDDSWIEPGGSNRSTCFQVQGMCST